MNSLEMDLAASLVHVIGGKRADAEEAWNHASPGTAAERRAYQVLLSVRGDYLAALERYFALAERRLGRKPLRSVV